MKPVTIYGIFTDGDDRCLYVGRTCRPENRKQAHARTFPGREFRVLSQVTKKSASAAEKKAIGHYKSLGQAEHNGNLSIDTKPVNISTELLHYLKVASTFEDRKLGEAAQSRLLNSLNADYGSFQGLVDRLRAYYEQRDAQPPLPAPGSQTETPQNMTAAGAGNLNGKAAK